MKKILLIILLLLLISTTSCSFKELFCKHDYQITKEQDSTCLELGHRTFTCSKCGKTKDEVIVKKAHEYVLTEEIVATCTHGGSITKECKNCGDKQVTTTNKLEHNFNVVQSTIPANCTESKQVIYKCHDCDATNQVAEGSPLGHNFGDYSVKLEATETTDGILIRTCNLCGYVEETPIPCNNYIDLSVIKYDYKGEDHEYNISTKEDMALLFNSAVLHLATTIKVKYSFDTTNLLDYISEHYTMGMSYKVSVNENPVFKTLKFTLEYGAVNPTISASENDLYTQYDSLNLTYKIADEDKRSDDFDNFKINSSSLSMDDVKSSHQLFYALERFVKPNCKVGSVANRIYNSCKEILRNIISDKMTDYEKLRAIYEYVIMNVCYDKALYSMIGSISNPELYKGFSLEGVFIDKRAVCEGISQAVVCLCNIEGIRCVQVTGKQAANLNGIGHAWNKVYLEGNWYILDATSGGTIISNDENPFEVLTYNYFLISNDEYQAKYVEENFQNIICFKKYPVYEEMKYTSTLGEKSFAVNNFEELVLAMRYYENNKTLNSTMEIKFNYKPSSKSGEISRSFAAVGHVGSFNYVENGDTVLLIND